MSRSHFPVPSPVPFKDISASKADRMHRIQQADHLLLKFCCIPSRCLRVVRSVSFEAGNDHLYPNLAFAGGSMRDFSISVSVSNKLVSSFPRKSLDHSGVAWNTAKNPDDLILRIAQRFETELVIGRKAFFHQAQADFGVARFLTWTERSGVAI